MTAIHFPVFGQPFSFVQGFLAATFYLKGCGKQTTLNVLLVGSQGSSV